MLDGQQRLSSLYGVFCADRILDKVSAGYDIDPEIFNISFDLHDKVFLLSQEKQAKKRYIDLKILLNNVEFNKAMRKGFTDEEITVASQLQSAFSNYEVPMVVTKKRTLGEVGIIFERINNSGTKLELFDLMVAWTWTKEFHLKEEFDKIFDTLAEKNFGGIEIKVILQCLSGVVKESSRSKNIIELTPKEVRDNIGLLKNSLEKTVDYLDTQLLIKSRDLLPHSHQIVPLCYFFSKVNSPTARQSKVIKEWFWKTSFSDRYASSTDAHIDEDIAAFKKLIEKKDNDIFKKYSYAITEDQLRESLFRKGNPLTRAFIILLAQYQPLDLINGNKIDLGEALSSFNKKEYHHIFPKSFLKTKGIVREKINSMCNFCLLPADSNKKIGDSSPSDYFSKKVFRNKKSKQILESNLMPLKKNIYDTNDYDSFLKDRASLVLEFINAQLI